MSASVYPKGRNVLACFDDYVVIDFETTGLDPKYDEIIEMAAIRVVCGKPCGRFVTFVKPSDGIPDFVTHLTGITDDMVADAPPISDVISEFVSFVGENPIVGHNVNFDINFLNFSLLSVGAAPVLNDFLDTMRLSRRLFPDFRHHRLRDLVKRFDISPAVSHRALVDATHTFGVYEFLKSYISDNQISVDSLIPRRKKRDRWLDARDIHSTTTHFDESNPFFGRVCAFTGALERMVRRDAMQIVVNFGGICANDVTRNTNYLILGNNDYCASLKGGKSSKQKKAEKLILDGFDLTILSENVFYDMIDEWDEK